MEKKEQDMQALTVGELMTLLHDIDPDTPIGAGVGGELTQVYFISRLGNTVYLSDSILNPIQLDNEELPFNIAYSYETAEALRDEYREKLQNAKANGKMTHEAEKIIEKMRAMYSLNNEVVEYRIPDNCPGDGEEGWFSDKEIYRSFGGGMGETFTYEEVLDDIGEEGLRDILTCAEPEARPLRDGERLYAPLCYSDDGTNIEYFSPAELDDNELFKSISDVEEFMSSYGYDSDTYSVQEVTITNDDTYVIIDPEGCMMERVVKQER